MRSKSRCGQVQWLLCSELRTGSAQPEVRNRKHMTTATEVAQPETGSLAMAVVGHGELKLISEGPGWVNSSRPRVKL